jgi:hypothetical protein
VKALDASHGCFTGLVNLKQRAFTGGCQWKELLQAGVYRVLGHCFTPLCGASTSPVGCTAQVGATAKPEKGRIVERWCLPVDGAVQRLYWLWLAGECALCRIALLDNGCRHVASDVQHVAYLRLHQLVARHFAVCCACT